MNNSVRKPGSILMTTDTPVAEWSYTLDIIRGLDRYDVTVALAAVGTPPTSDQMREASILPNVDMFECGVKDGWSENAEPECPERNDIVLAEEWLEGLQHIIRPDVIHLIGNRFGFLKWDSPVLITLLEPITVKPDSLAASSLRGVFRKAGIIVAHTQALLDSLTNICSDIKDTRVIPNTSFNCMADAYFSAYSDLTGNNIDAKKYSFL